MNQFELTLLGQTNAPIREIPSETVACWTTEQEAYRHCCLAHPAKLSQEKIAERIGLKRGNFNTVLNSDAPGRVTRSLLLAQLKDLQKECRCYCIDQWADMYDKGLLNHQRTTTDREAILLAELAEIRASR